MPSPSRVQHTLARHRLGVPAILAVIVSAAAPMAGIFGGETAGFAETGLVALPLALIGIAVLLALWAPGYVAMGREIINAGSCYSYIAHGLGRVPGVAAGGVALVAYNMMQLAFYGGFGLAAAQLTESLGVPTQWWMWALPAWLVVAALGSAKIDLSTRVLLVLLAAEVGIVVVFTAAFVAQPGPQGVDPAALNPAQLGQTSTWVALAFAFAGFVGLESCSAFSEEARNRTAFARAIVLAIIGVGVLYGVGTWALTVATGPNQVVGQANAHGTDLGFFLAAQRLPFGWVLAGHLLYASSMFAGLLAWHNVCNRYAFALGREGVLPRWLGTTSAAGAPRAASVTQSVLAALVLIVMLVSHGDPLVNLWYWGSTAGAVGVLSLLVATSISVLVYLARAHHPRQSIGLLTTSLLAALGLATVLVAALTHFSLLLGTAPGDPAAWILPSLFAVAAIAGAGWALLLRGTRPRVWRQLGQGTGAALVALDTERSSSSRATSHGSR